MKRPGVLPWVLLFLWASWIFALQGVGSAALALWLPAGLLIRRRLRS